MAYPSLTAASVANQKAAGISKLYIKGSSDTNWQSLGYIRNGELKVSPYSTEDTYKRNHSHAFTIEAKVELLQTALAEVELIPTLVAGTNSFLFKLTDAEAIPASAAQTFGWVYLTSSQVGVSAKFQSDGNPSTNQFIELVIKGSVTGSLDSILKANIDDGHFHITTDPVVAETFSASNVFAEYTTTAGGDSGIKANIKPNGFSTVKVKQNTDASYTTLGRVRNGKIICDFIAEEDSLNRPNVYGVDVNIEYEYLESNGANMILLDDLNSTNTDVQVTLLDNKVFTLASNLGVNVSFENVGDFDKFRVIKFVHKGRILVTGDLGFNSIVA